MRVGFALLCVSLGILLAAPIALAADGFGGAELAKPKKAKAKAKKCKKNRVRVQFAGKARCLPLKAALPKPRAEDPRLAAVKEGLTPPLGSVPDPKDRIPVPLEKVYRQLSPKALPAMEKAVATALPRLDKLGAARAAGAGKARASAGGGSFSQQIGNVKIDARLSIAATAAGLVGTAEYTLTTGQGGGRSVHVTTRVPIRLERFGFESDVCPGADGKLDATDGIGITIHTEVRSNNGKHLDEYFTFEVADDTEMQGIVGDDAKLDTLEIRSIQKINEKAAGSVIGDVVWAGSEVNATIVRNTVVDMRTGEYRPTVVPINVGVALGGILRLFPTGPTQQAVAERLKKSADKDFAATVDFEMKKFRELEEGWRKPNTCAKLAFGKPNGSLTLRKGDKGTETVRVDAVRGGSPAKAQWSLVSAALIAPALGSDSANPNSFSYEVLFAGQNLEATATYKAVSKAGIAEGTWAQKTEQKSINQIAGTFSFKQSVLGSVFEWSGNVVFDRYTPNVIGGPNGGFKVTSGLYTFTVSGNDVLVVGSTCSQKGSGQFAVSPTGELSAFGQFPDLVAPYDYSFQLSSIGIPMITITLFNCGPGAEELEGDQFSYPASLFFTQEDPHQSLDGIDFSGSETVTQGIVTLEKIWSLKGTE
jgi:hypothetical protein